MRWESVTSIPLQCPSMFLLPHQCAGFFAQEKVSALLAFSYGHDYHVLKCMRLAGMVRLRRLTVKTFVSQVPELCDFLSYNMHSVKYLHLNVLRHCQLDGLDAFEFLG